MNSDTEHAKAEYICKALARAHKKSWENYVITRIWHRLDRPDVKFVTQQYVVRPKGHALVDLYLPQLRMFVEVDEPQHERPPNKASDDIRKEDIISLSDRQRFHRIRISDPHDIGKINEQCDKLVAKIRRHIRTLGSSFKPWDSSEEDPRTYIQRGRISLADNVAFRTCKDAANCFGHEYRGYQHGITNHPHRKDASIWFPKLYPHGEWENTISPDGTVIREKNIDKEKNKSQINAWLDNPRCVRIVFAQGKDPLGIMRYRFKGVFRLNRRDTNNEQCAVWKRIADRVDTVSAKK